MAKAYSQPCRTSKMDLLQKIINVWKIFFFFFTVSPILNVRLGSEYTSEWDF